MLIISLKISHMFLYKDTNRKMKQEEEEEKKGPKSMELARLRPN